MCAKHSSQDFSNSPISNNLTISSNTLLIRPYVPNMFYLALYNHSLPFFSVFFVQEDFVYMNYFSGLLPSNFQLGWSIGTPGRRSEGSKKNEFSVFIFLSSFPVGSSQANFVPQLKVTVPLKVAHCITLYYWVLVTIPPLQFLCAVTSPRELHYTPWFL